MIFTITATSFSGSPEDGRNGRDGINGVDGTDGAPGADGQDGVDGNANVRVFTYDISNVSNSFHDQGISAITQEVINNDVVLGYVISSNPNILIPIPASSNRFLRFDVEVFINVGIYSIDFLDNTGTPLNINPGDLTRLKIVIIESTSSTTGKSSKEDVLLELKKADVDVVDYYQVVEYFNLEN